MPATPPPVTTAAQAAEPPRKPEPETAGAGDGDDRPPISPERRQPARIAEASDAPSVAAAAPRSRRGLVVALTLLLVAGAAGGALYLYRDAILPALAPQDTRSGEGAGGEASAPRTAERPKVTDRLPQDGQPATPPTAGERQTSLPKSAEPARTAEAPSVAPPQPAQAQPAPSQPAQIPPAPPAVGQTVPVAQQAQLTEESPTPGAEARFAGRVQWRMETEPGQGTPRPLIRGIVDVPERGLKMMLTVKRNTDPNFAATHVVELLFETPREFDAGGIANVPAILAKESAVARSNPLKGASERVTNGYFMIALAKGEAERKRNLELLRMSGWFDVPILYNNGRRAVLAIEKGTPGEQIFRQALDAWDAI